MTTQAVQFLENNKCEDIRTFKCTSYIVGNVVIATTLGGNHAVAVAEKLLIDLKSQNIHCIIDGDAKDGWVVIEVADWNIMIHLMIQQKREFFNLEEFLQSRIK